MFGGLVGIAPWPPPPPPESLRVVEVVEDVEVTVTVVAAGFVDVVS